MKLYHHKTSGGAEYLTDTFIPWEHNGKSGKEGTMTVETKICVRIDGDITKDAEISIVENKEPLGTDLTKEIIRHASEMLNRYSKLVNEIDPEYYSSSDLILYSDDLEKVIKGEVEPEDLAKTMKQIRLFTNV